MSSLDDLIQLSESFERFLGNPRQEDSLLSMQQSVHDDEEESLPLPQLTAIQQWGYVDYLIPRSLGGKLDSLTVLYSLNKIIARRDITVAITLGLTFFSALPIWLAGTDEQKRQLSERIRKGEIGALALTEEEHGSDLTANRMTAQRHESGWELSGAKWCINFATLGPTVSVLCRTHDKGGLLGFSLFFIDKAQIKKGLVSIPKLPTHGVRGLDISGFSLDKILLPNDALIGTERRGLEITYKVFQVSRTLCACLSVGGADTALRLALSFSLQRQLYGSSVYEIPAVKQRLGELFTHLLIADCLSWVMIRACTAMPKKMSLWSAIVKFLVPKITEDIVSQCGIVMGARAYLRTTQWAIFQKIRRDIEVIGLFDGSSQVNLSLIAGNLLPQASKRGTNHLVDLTELKQIFDLNQECPIFDEDNLTLFAHEEDAIFAGLALIKSDPIDSLVTQVRKELHHLDTQVLHLRDQKLFEPRGLAAFRLAEHYCWLFAASCCLQFWYYNQGELAPQLQNTGWLHLATQLIMNQIAVKNPIDSALQEVMAEHLCVYHQGHQLFSVLPIQLAEG